MAVYFKPHKNKPKNNPHGRVRGKGFYNFRPPFLKDREEAEYDGRNNTFVVNFILPNDDSEDDFPWTMHTHAFFMDRKECEQLIKDLTKALEYKREK